MSEKDDKRLVDNCNHRLGIICRECKYKYSCKPYQNTKSESDMDVHVIFNLAPDKFKELAKDKTASEFIMALYKLDNFEMIKHMNAYDKQELYALAKGLK
jgi:hypothetical protein